MDFVIVLLIVIGALGLLWRRTLRRGRTLRSARQNSLQPDNPCGTGCAGCHGPAIATGAGPMTLVKEDEVADRDSL